MTGRLVARLPLDLPLDELAELLAAITRCERAHDHDVDVRVHGDLLDVTEHEEAA